MSADADNTVLSHTSTSPAVVHQESQKPFSDMGQAESKQAYPNTVGMHSNTGDPTTFEGNDTRAKQSRSDRHYETEIEMHSSRSSRGDFSSYDHSHADADSHAHTPFDQPETPMSGQQQVEFSISRWGEILTANGLEEKEAEIHKKLNTVSEAQRQTERGRELKWREMHKDWAKWTTKEKNHLISRIHKGIPESFRGVIWPLLSGSKARQDENPGAYDRLWRTPCVDEHTIMLDITRTLPNHVLFCRRDRGADNYGSSNTTQRRAAALAAMNSSPSRSTRDPECDTDDASNPSCDQVADGDNSTTKDTFKSPAAIDVDAETTAETKTAQAPATPIAATSASQTDAEMNPSSPGSNAQPPPTPQPQSAQLTCPAAVAAATLGSSRSREALMRVVRAYANLDPEVGYCQGISFIAATCLLYLPEEEAFWLLETLLRSPKFNFRGLFLRGFPIVRRWSFMLEALLTKYEPKLMDKLKQSYFTFMMLCPQWFICLFTYNFPVPIAARIWDLLFCAAMFGESTEAVVLQVPLALFRAYKDKLMPASPEAVITIVCKQLLKDPEIVGSPDVFVQRVLKSPIKTSTLTKLADKFRAENEASEAAAAAAAAAKAQKK